MDMVACALDRSSSWLYLSSQKEEESRRARTFELASLKGSWPGWARRARCVFGPIDPVDLFLPSCLDFFFFFFLKVSANK